MQAQALLKQDSESHKESKFANLLALSADFKDASADYTKVQSQERGHLSRRAQTERSRSKSPSAERQRKWSVPSKPGEKMEGEEEDTSKEQHLQVPTTRKKRKVWTLLVESDWSFVCLFLLHCVHLQTIVGKFMSFYKGKTSSEQECLAQEPINAFSQAKQVTKLHVCSLLHD